MSVRAYSANPFANAQINGANLTPGVVVNKFPQPPIGNPLPQPSFNLPVLVATQWPRPPLGNPIPDVGVAFNALSVKEG